MTARRTSLRRKQEEPRRSPPQAAHQFLIVLAETAPLVWRRIQVPEGYSFWDLHVAIQDAMGWQDSHLHEFRVMHPSKGRLLRIGVPDPGGPEDHSLLADWQVPIIEYLTPDAPPVSYVYDFGDNWCHALINEGPAPVEPFVTYPRCLGGAGACPPEDCGGAHRYGELLAAVADPKHPEHAEFVAWLGSEFDPADFDAATVSFDDPQQRWKRAFEGR